MNILKTPTARFCPPPTQSSMEMANLFVSNLWITQRLVAFAVDKSVDNLWISRFLLIKSVT